MPALAYLGHRAPDGRTAVVALDDFARPARPLPLRHDLAGHSAAFAWGYAGSGPAQLALALLADHLGDGEEALALHQELKHEVIERIARNTWALFAEDLDCYVARLRLAAHDGLAPIPVYRPRFGDWP